MPRETSVDGSSDQFSRSAVTIFVLSNIKISLFVTGVLRSTPNELLLQASSVPRPQHSK